MEEGEKRRKMLELCNEVNPKGNKGEQTVRNSWGVYDYYKHYRRTRPKTKDWVIKEAPFYRLIRKVNARLAKMLVEDGYLTLPKNMGRVEILKTPTYVRYKDGKLRTNRPVNWRATLEWWVEDSEAKEKKLLIRHEQDSYYGVLYVKREAIYPNKEFYDFRITRGTKRMMSDTIKNGGLNVPFFQDPQKITLDRLYNG